MIKKHHILLFVCTILSEAKSIFYNVDVKVRNSIFSEDKRWLCNVVEDYANILIFGVLFFLLTYASNNVNIRRVAVFLFILNLFDLVHLGLYDMQFFIPLKLAFAYLIFKIWDLRK